MFFRKKREENVVKSIYKQDKLVRYSQFVLGVFLAALSFNIFILPNQVVYGVGGIAVILNKLFSFDPSLVIFIGSVLLLILSFILLGFEKTRNTIVGSLLYPLFVKLTANMGQYVDLGTQDTLVVVIFGAVISGFGLGLVFKAGFTTGGTDVLNHIFSKYFNVSIGRSMIFTDGAIILLGVFAFGWLRLMYSIVSLYIISLMTDKVMLGISQSKAFYIITEHETAIKKYIMDNLSHGITVLEGRGGYTGDNKKVIMCVIPTSQYFMAKEGIHKIDKDAFFMVTDAYEVYGGE